MIRREGIDNLTTEELQNACIARGMRALGVPVQRMKSDLKQVICCTKITLIKYYDTKELFSDNFCVMSGFITQLAFVFFFHGLFMVVIKYFFPLYYSSSSPNFAYNLSRI